VADTFSSRRRDASGGRLLALTLAGVGLLAVAIITIAPDRQVAASESAASREVAAAPTSRGDAIGERVVQRPAPREPMMRSVSEDDELPDQSAKVVAPETVERIDELAERIRDESGLERKAAIQEAMSVAAQLPPEQAAVLLARLDRTATPPDDEMHGPGEPTPQGD
jgi:hypothetical protein